MTSATHETNLAKTTLRAVGLLVGCCVVFVGVLSVLAVVLTGRAVASVQEGEAKTRTSETTAAAKKPLSI